MPTADDLPDMLRRRHTRPTTAAIAALAIAGSLWGLTVPLSKLGMGWLDAGWLAVARFAIAAPLLALFARRNLRAAASPAVVGAGAAGYGVVIVLQNAGIERTSVTHAALIVGAVPVLVAVIGAVLGRGAAGVLTWAGSLLALAGVALVAGGGGAGTSLAGDLLVLASVSASAGFIVAQPSLLRGRDAAAVTAVQLAAGGAAALPFAVVFEGAPAAPASAAPAIAVLALALTGTALAFWLFAWAQARVPAEVAGAFVNLEPLVGAATGAVAFGDAVGGTQLLGAAAILAGIALGALPRRSPLDRAPAGRTVVGQCRRPARQRRRRGAKTRHWRISVYMRPKTAKDLRLAALADDQHGVVSRAQLLREGFASEDVARLARARRLRRVHRGVYAVGHRMLTVEGRWMAAVLAGGRGAVLSHGTAGAAWALRPVGGGAIHVTVPSDGGRERRAGLKVHRSITLTPEQTTTYRGIPITTPERTIIDLAKTLKGRPLEHAIDLADQRGLIDFATLRAARSISLQAVLERYAPAPTRSELEERFLRLCEDHGIPRPDTNTVIHGFEVDFVWRDVRLVVEVDGYRYHRSPTAFEDDREKDVVLATAGWQVMRFTWRQVSRRPGWVAAATKRRRATALRPTARG